ncbi:formate dehydrogenase accessory protein FdhE [Thermomonas brevis]
MAQHILQRGEIETLAQREIPRIVPLRRETAFASRAERLRALAPGNPIAGYLELMAALAQAQQEALDALDAAGLQRLQQDALAQQPDAAREAGMPPLHAGALRRDGAWRDGLRRLCARVAEAADAPEAVGEVLARLRDAGDAWLDAQADALLGVPGADAQVDAAAAPFVMAGLQLHWTALALAFDARALQPMADAPGLCPCCGTPPVASVVHASAPHAGYRYLACGLCGLQWHYVRVQCSGCGGRGKDIAQQAMTRADAGSDDAKAAAVRAETCDACHGYRKILYAEKDQAVEALADDLASLPLDLMLAEQGYARLGRNPLLWQPDGE